IRSGKRSRPAARASVESIRSSANGGMVGGERETARAARRSCKKAEVLHPVQRRNSAGAAYRSPTSAPLADARELTGADMPRDAENRRRRSRGGAGGFAHGSSARAAARSGNADRSAGGIRDGRPR